MSNIRQRSIKGASLTQAEVDANDKIQVSGHVASYTLTKNDNQDTQEFNGASLNATLPSVVTITNTLTGSETGEFTTTIKNIHSTTLTITPDGLDKIDGINSSVVLKQNTGIILQTNDAKDGWNSLSQLFTSGSETFVNVAGSSGGTPVNVVHGLGTDDIDFGLMLTETGSVGSAGIILMSAVIMDANGYFQYIYNATNFPTDPGLTTQKPPTGNLRMNVFNNSGLAINNFIIKWWARRR